MKIILKGRIPSKKNSKFIAKVRQKTYLLPSQDYQAWHKEQMFMLPHLDKPFKADLIEMVFWFPDNRKTDLTNKAESVMDLLVDKGIIEDDCWQSIPMLNLLAGGIDMGNPRCEINLL